MRNNVSEESRGRSYQRCRTDTWHAPGGVKYTSEKRELLLTRHRRRSRRRDESVSSSGLRRRRGIAPKGEKGRSVFTNHEEVFEMCVFGLSRGLYDSATIRQRRRVFANHIRKIHGSLGGDRFANSKAPATGKRRNATMRTRRRRGWAGGESSRSFFLLVQEIDKVNAVRDPRVPR